MLAATATALLPNLAMGRAQEKSEAESEREWKSEGRREGISFFNSTWGRVCATCRAAGTRLPCGARGQKLVGHDRSSPINWLPILEIENQLILLLTYDWKLNLSHPLPPKPVVHWFWRRRQSCRALQGEQYCFNNQELNWPGLEDIEFQGRVPQNWIMQFSFKRLKLPSSPPSNS
jgi:hypothetical protein